MIGWWPCTPLTNLETFGNKISTSTCSSKEKEGLKKKIVKLCVSEFLRGELRARMSVLSACIARYGPVGNC